MRARALISVSALAHNWKTITAHARGSQVCAVVKANAYGHGMEIVAPALWEAGCRWFATTDAEEGRRLLDILSGRHPKVLVLSPPEDDEALALFRAH
ncbi:MAG: alanine racemase, partial [Zetaproteobacteria bacterium]